MPSAVLFSTEAEFDVATLSSIVSSLGLLRFGEAGHDCSSMTGWTNQAGSWATSRIQLLTLTNAVSRSVTRDGTSGFADGTLRARVRLFAKAADGGTVATTMIEARQADDSNYYLAGIEPTTLSLYKRVGGSFTQLATTAQAYAIGDIVDLRFALSGTSLTAYDDTNSKSATITDSALASGSIGFYCNGPGALFEFLRQDSTSLTGSASLPTSITYTDLGAAKLMGRVTWDETLDSGDVTVDVYGSDNGTSDAAGASVTGLTDPAGSDCSAAGSHRYWRVVVNFTRTLTTQEPTVSRIALAQTAAPSGGAGRSQFVGAGMRVS